MEENLTDSVSDDVFIEPGDIIYEECDISEAQLIDNLEKEISSLKFDF